jgi:hypothetical protein
MHRLESLSIGIGDSISSEHALESVNDLLPSLNVGDDLDHMFLQGLFIVVTGPPATAVEVDEVRTPALRKTQPLTRRLN